jgi:hypothetical protein
LCLPYALTSIPIIYCDIFYPRRVWRAVFVSIEVGLAIVSIIVVLFANSESTALLTQPVIYLLNGCAGVVVSVLMSIVMVGMRKLE